METIQKQQSYLNEHYKLTEDQIEAYQRDGHTLIRGLLTPEQVEEWKTTISDAVQAYSKDLEPLEERDTYGKAFIQIINLWEKVEAIRPYVFAERFAKVAADLMGVSGVRLYHDQALYKEAGGGFTPWHQDQFYWALDGVKTVTMWMPLVDVSEDMGALTFASGSHKEGFLGHISISDESEERFSKYVADKGYPVVMKAMAAGDATFHSGWCLHCAPGNNTNRMREVMTIIYMEDGAVISEPDNFNREQDMRRFFPNLKPGDKAASHLNPLLYSRETQF